MFTHQFFELGRYIGGDFVEALNLVFAAGEAIAAPIEVDRNVSH